MARTKQPTPQQRQPSSEWIERSKTTNGHAYGNSKVSVQDTANDGDKERQRSAKAMPVPSKQAGLPELIVCVLGIYTSFLLWAFLQERITTISYGPPAAPEVFTYSVFLNTVQSILAFIVGYAYLHFSTRNTTTPAIFPTRSILPPLLLVALTSSLASPFGYASLKHVGYITFILAKSCKLLPVMALQVSIFRRRYPLYKYAVVALVTAGVAVFSLNHGGGGSSKKSKTVYEGASVPWGLMLLGINLLFDGLTNSTQDYINGAFKPYSGSQLMCANNLLSTALTGSYLLLSPYLSATPIGRYVGMTSQAGELQAAVAFLSRHPPVLWDVLGFAACGAIGQVFIFYTIVKFSSLVLVTVTVTRKMLTMFLSVIWFGHTLSWSQWGGVAMVFGGIAAEAAVGRAQKANQSKVAKKQ